MIALIILISFLPIILWWYAFSYVDSSTENRKRFFLWILWWIISVFPIIYSSDIAETLSISFLNIFDYMYALSDIVSLPLFFISLSIFLFFIVIFSFVFGSVVHKFRNIFYVYLRNFLVFLFLVLLLSLFIFTFKVVFPYDIYLSSDTTISYQNIVLNSLKLVIFYYLLVAFIEEASKHFNFLQSSFVYIDSVKTWVLYAIFVALGFSFVENILYFYDVYSKNWIWSELLTIYFFRSTFSIMVHILVSSVIAFYFSKALLLYRSKDLSFPYLKIFLKWLFIGIILHLVFDVSITLWFSFMIILYFVWGYLYVSSIFYRE